MDEELGVTFREAQVLDLLVEGMSSKLIGRALGISVRTVETHLRNLRLKTGSPNRAALASWWTARRQIRNREDSPGS